MSHLLVCDNTSLTQAIEGLNCYRDMVTPTHDFLICPHPAAPNLYIATGGSFHSWKFFPSLGNFVVSMLEGKLNPELSERWAWNHKQQQPSNKRVFLSRELADLKSNSS